jgi:hypothetical protein
MTRSFNPSKPIFTTSDRSLMRWAGAYGVVNAVSLYVEHGGETFHSVHVESARRVAAQARLAKILPRPPITQNQVELMQIDTVASSELPGFETLGITPVAVEEILQEILWDH